MTRKPAMSNASTAPDPLRHDHDPDHDHEHEHRHEHGGAAPHDTFPDAHHIDRHRTEGEHFDAEDFFGLQRTPSERLPDPLPLVENLSRCVIEVLAGARELDQLARWVTDDVYRHLLKRVVLAARARAVKAAPVRRPQLTIGHTVMCRPRDDVVEAVVVVHGRARTRAVAIRLEGLDSRWRASAVSVL